MGFGCGVLAGFGWLCGASPGFAFTFAFLAWTGLLGCWALFAQIEGQFETIEVASRSEIHTISIYPVLEG